MKLGKFAQGFWAALLTGLYFCSGLFGLKLAVIHPQASAVWPPTGIALGALLLAGDGIWPGVLLGAFLVNIFTDQHAGIAAAIAVGNTLEALTAAHLVRLTIPRPHRFDCATDVGRFAMAICLAAAISSTVGTLALLLGHFVALHAAGAVWNTWWLGDVVGGILVAPLFSFLISPSPEERYGSYSEAFALCLGAALVGAVVFTGLLPLPAATDPLQFLCVPIVLWAAFRFGTRGTTLVSVFFAAVALWGTMHGYGPFTRFSGNESLLVLQGFIGITALLGLAVAAIAAEKNRSTGRLALQFRVGQILSSSAESQTVLDEGLAAIGKGFGWDWGAYWSVEKVMPVLSCTQTWQVSGEAFDQFQARTENLSLGLGQGAPGQVWASGQPQWIPFDTNEGKIPRFKSAIQAKLRSGVAFPVCGSEGVLGVVEFFTRREERCDGVLLACLASIGNEIGRFLETRYTESRRKAMAESAFDCIISLDQRGVVEDFNPAAERTFGYTRAEAIGRNFADLIFTPALKEEYRDGISRFLTALEPSAERDRRREIPACRADGTQILVELAIAPWHVGARPFFTAYLRDVTKIREMQQTLNALLSEQTEAHRQVEERYRLLVEETKDYAIYILDTTGHISSWNIGAERAKGYASHEVIGKHVSLFYTPEDRASGKAQKLLKEALEKGRVEDEGWRVRKDGTRFWANVVVTALYDSRRVHTGFGKITRDLTDRRKAEEKLRQQEAELAQSRKLEAIGQLAGGVAHDFNNLLTGIIGMTEEVKASFEPGDPRAHELEGIIEASRRAFDLTRQLLAFGRRQTIQPKVLAIQTVIQDTSNLLKRLIGEDIQLHVETPGTSAILADASQLQQVVMNLALNGRDAMPDGGTLSIRTRDISIHEDSLDPKKIQPGRYVLLEVQDTGTGMTEDVQTHIFEPFFTTKEKNQGTGLGLSTVYGIVKQHGGDIQVESELGKGSTFRIYWRATDQVESVKGSPATSGVSKGTATVMVVEDEDIVRRVVVRKLVQLGYSVVEARNGPDALGKPPAVLENLDLILTDVVMPGMNGRQLVERLRERFPKVAAVYMSGYPEEHIASRGVIDPEVDFVDKTALDADLPIKLKVALAKRD